MIYIKAETIKKISSEETEKNLRKLTKRRKKELDYVSVKYDTREKEYFLGFENDNNLEVTRIKSSLEFFIPRLIVRFNKSDFTKYKVRLGIPSLIFISFALIYIIFGLIDSIKYEKIGDIIFLLGLSLLIPGLIYFELFLTKRKINKTIIEGIANQNKLK